MKQLTALLLAAALLLALAACGGREKETDPPAGPAAPAEQTQNAGTAPNEPELTEGSLEGSVYTNEYMGFTCTLDGTWVYSTREEIDALMGGLAADEDLSGMDLAARLERSGTFMDMHAATRDRTLSASLIYERANAVTEAYTTREYAETACAQVQKVLASMSGDVVSNEVKTVSFLGQEHDAILTETTVEGVPFYQMQVILRQGAYFCIFTATSLIVDLTADVLDCCQPI